MASSSLTLKGCPLNGCSSDSGISCIFSSLASWRLSSVENKSSYGASSTFFALLFKFYHLLGQILIALGHLAIGSWAKMLLPSALISFARTEWGISVPNTLILLPQVSRSKAAITLAKMVRWATIVG